MLQGRVKTWVKRGGITVGLLVLIGAAYCVCNWQSLNARYVASRLQSVTTDEDRAACVNKLLDCHDAGMPYFLAIFHGVDESACEIAVTSLKERLATLPPDDPRFAALCTPMLAGLNHFSDAGKVAALELIPELVSCPTLDAVTRGQSLVSKSLSGNTTAGKLRGIRHALRPQIACAAEIVPLLNDPDVEVRRAAMLAVGPTADVANAVIGTEELFKWLHDSDAEVRNTCASALRTRGLEWDHISLARQLTHPDPAERLNLLVDLAQGTTVNDAGPWLERLSRDPDPAVRLGAARVAYETRLQFAAWLEKLATNDPDPTVRRWSGYYRNLTVAVRQTGYTRE